jgi:hypothetical protein
MERRKAVFPSWKHTSERDSAATLIMPFAFLQNIFVTMNIVATARQGRTDEVLPIFGRC